MSETIHVKPSMQILVSSILKRALHYFPEREIVSKGTKKMWRYTYANLNERVSRLANVLSSLGVERGDRVATFAANTYRHLELYFALPCMGSVVHPLNIMLSDEQLIYIMNQAEDKLLFVDDNFIPRIEAVKDELKTVKGYVIMTDEEKMPKTSLSPIYSYEELVAKASSTYEFPDDLDEDDAIMMCYTSGTTGIPRGLFYNHKTPYLCALDYGLVDGPGISEADVMLQVVPMYHAGGWHYAYTGTMYGAKQVFPGFNPRVEDLCKLVTQERVTFASGVPTVWISILDYVEKANIDISSLKKVVVGGAPPPRALLEKVDAKGINVMHQYGLTETVSILTLSRDLPYTKKWPKDLQFARRARQGIPYPSGELKALNDEGKEVKWDGKELGTLYFRSPGMPAEYYKSPEATAELFSSGGWLNTQDIVTIDEAGYVQLVDRSKDLIKSGGEWISSILLENSIMAHPKVLEAAVVAIPHESWIERPLAWVVPKKEYVGQVTKEEILEFLGGMVKQGKLAKWWLPDDIVFVEAIPKTGTGKFDKKLIRSKYMEK